MERRFRCLHCKSQCQLQAFRCTYCGALRTIVPMETSAEPRVRTLASWVGTTDAERVITETPFDELLAGDDARGVPLGNVTLTWGEPGSRKTTRMLDLASRIAVKTSRAALFVSLEMDPARLPSYARRVGADMERIFVTPDTHDLDDVVAGLRPAAIVIDSLAFVGSESDQRHTLLRCIAWAREPAWCGVIQHVNKEGDPAGPMRWEHIVDTTMHLAPTFAATKKHRHGPSPRLVELSI